MTNKDTTMLEHAARAGAEAAMLAEGLSENYAAQASASHELNMNYYGSIVRAILNELKQVDEGMTIAVSEALQGDFWIGPTAAAKVIRAHIDHVLREGEGK